MKADRDHPQTASTVVQRSGGVCAVGMSGSVAGVNREISSGAGPQGSATAGASPKGKVLQAGGEAGESRSSVEAQDSTTCAERRGALVLRRVEAVRDREMAGTTRKTSGHG